MLGRLLPVCVLLVGTLLGLCLSDSHAEDGKKRGYALLVGVRDYSHIDLEPLQYTERDVEELAKLIDRPGSPFHGNVRVLTSTRGKRNRDDEPTAANIRKALAGLVKGRTRNDMVLVALSGHGVQLAVRDPAGKEKDKSYGYFCPADTDLVGVNYETGRHERLILLADLFDDLGLCGASAKLVLMDACRNELKVRARSLKVSKELVPEGVAALFSCKAGEHSYEAVKLGHGVFFHYVLQGLKGGAKNARDEVTWSRLAEYVTEKVIDEAPVLLGRKVRQTPHPVLNAPGKSPVLLTVNQVENSIGMKFVKIPKGAFKMGSPKSEKDRDDDEAQHEVEITRPFYLGVHEVSLGQFRRFTKDSGYRTEAARGRNEAIGWTGKGQYPWASNKKYDWHNPGFSQTDEHPVVCVSLNDAQAFCDWLSKKEGTEYRLPTEAEWEYACRAGTKTRFWGGDHDEDLRGVANCPDSSLKEYLKRLNSRWAMGIGGWYVSWDDGQVLTAPVGSFRANPWGLHDMHGNVCEWCSDWYAKEYDAVVRKDPTGPKRGTAHVSRGGSFHIGPRYARSANRDAHETDDSYGFWLGFRVVMSANP